MHTDATGSAAPDAFGRFRVLHQIGAGALGPVFRAFDPSTDRLVAVKLFRLDLPPERVHQLVADFEGLIETQLTHPAIATPLAAGTVGNQPYLAAEFVPAESLDIVVRDHGPAPLGHAIGLAAQLAGAIDFAAVVHVGHGTLHPRDVLVSQDETRVTGLGIAQALERAGVPRPLRRPYAAPECVDDRPWGHEADVFSVAAICYELLMGRRIAGAGTDAAQGLVGVPGLDVEMARAVFARALAVDPAHRFPSALEFVDALRNSMVETPVPAPVDAGESPRETRRPPRRDDEEPLLPLDEIARTERSVETPPLAGSAMPSDLELRAAEADRYQDVESSPAIVPSDAPPGDRFIPDALVVGSPASSDPAPPAFSSNREPADAAIHGETRGTAFAAAHLDAAPQPTVEPADLVVLRERQVDPSADRTESDMPVTEPDVPALSALERSRSAIWPLVLALLVGVALGFAAGYGVGTRGQAGQATSAVPSAAGREFTETAVPPARNAAPVEPKTAASSTSSAPAGAPANPSASAGSGASPTASTGAPAASRGSAGAGASGDRSGVTPPSADDESGHLLIRSTPDGARVYVDGRERGRTPLALRDLARGAHRVRIVRDGYTMEERRIVLTAKRPSQSLQVSLVRPPVRETAVAPAGAFVGMLSVESRPPGAKVFIDGRAVGTTPLSMATVPAGSHAVRLEHDGYRRWSSSVRVVAGERNRVTASLEK